MVISPLFQIVKKGRNMKKKLCYSIPIIGCHQCPHAKQYHFKIVCTCPLLKTINFEVGFLRGRATDLKTNDKSRAIWCPLPDCNELPLT
jgi:hypothetical protein